MSPNPGILWFTIVNAGVAPMLLYLVLLDAMNAWYR